MTAAQSAKARHTAGRLEIAGATHLWSPTGKANVASCSAPRARAEVGYSPPEIGDLEETAANAARLAACWNALEGIPTETLQQHGRWAPAVTLAERDALRAQLDAEQSEHQIRIDECKVPARRGRAAAGGVAVRFPVPRQNMEWQTTRRTFRRTGNRRNQQSPRRACEGAIVKARTLDLRDRCARQNCQILIKRFRIPQDNWKRYKPFCSYHCKEWDNLERAQAYINRGCK